MADHNKDKDYARDLTKLNHPSDPPTFGRSRILRMFSQVALLVLAISIAMVVHSINAIREVNRQKIIVALSDVTAGVQEHILIAEMIAGSVQGVVSSTEEEGGICGQICLRTALTSAVSSFERSSALDRLGLIIPDSGVFGNLERLENGNIVLWLASAQEDGEDMQSLLWVGSGFMPYRSALITTDAMTRENLRRLRARQTASQNAQSGEWQLRDQSWMVSSQQSDSTWEIGYSKALHDNRGRLIGVFDAEFSLASVQATLQTLQQRHDVRLTVVSDAESARMLRTDAALPQELWPQFSDLIDAQKQTQAPEVFTGILSLAAGRYWAGVQTLSLQGQDEWYIIITRHVPWRDVFTTEQMVYILAIALILIAGLGIILTRLMIRFIRDHNLKLNAELAHHANHDAVTGLPNHITHTHRLKHAIAHAQEHETKIALLYLSFDRLTTIHDSYGHRFASKVLRTAGKTLTRLIREQDMVAYLSNNHFIILVDQLRHKDEVHRLAHSIMEELKQPLTLEEREVNLATSIGVSLYPSHGTTPDELINNAYIAMSEARQSGGDCCQFFGPGMGNRIQEDLNLEIHLQHALAKNQFHLVYQPKVSLKDGKIVGCEVLLRWTHPDLGSISPARFIPIAEKTDLIVAIGDWVLRAACVQAKSWLDSGLKPASIAVNLSIRQFLRHDIVKWVAEILQETGLPTHCLELEITESLFPEDMERILTILNQLHRLGVKLSLDDFGTGYSNLRYLKRLKLDTLKIDQTFVRGALESSQNASIVRAVVDLAHNMGYKALAEGVETRQQLDFVIAQQCDEIQGYYFSRPVAAEIYAIMLRDGIRLEDVASKP